MTALHRWRRHLTGSRPTAGACRATHRRTCARAPTAWNACPSAQLAVPGIGICASRKYCHRAPTPSATQKESRPPSRRCGHRTAPLRSLGIDRAPGAAPVPPRTLPYRLGGTAQRPALRLAPCRTAHLQSVSWLQSTCTPLSVCLRPQDRADGQWQLAMQAITSLSSCNQRGGTCPAQCALAQRHTEPPRSKRRAPAKHTAAARTWIPTR